LLNYVGNAVKFTDRGAVALQVRLLVPDGPGLLLRFEVQDTGIGIAAGAMGSLFDAFVQADSSTTRRFGGSGLGLAITRRLARLMGGDADASSQLGVGSCFWFTASLLRCTAPPPLPADAGLRCAEDLLRRDFAGRTVLLVEDEPINREAVQLLLESVGLRVELAGDGLDAVARVIERRFDLVLMDMQMPLLDGPDASRRIRQTPNGAELPIVALTANVFARDRARCLAAGMNDFLSKPVDPLLLFGMVLHYLSLPASPTLPMLPDRGVPSLPA
jgi:CheY-like chemotaxis protein